MIRRERDIVKFNFCPTCGEYLNISYNINEPNRTCPLGHSLQIPKTVILANAILTDQSRILMERKNIFNREFWALPHVEIKTNEPPESTLSGKMQELLTRNITVETLLFADGDEHMFHLFYELRLMNSKSSKNKNTTKQELDSDQYQWLSWQDMPWEKLAYEHHKSILFQWISSMTSSAEGKEALPSMVLKHRGIKIL
jgi:hypothetical protein